MVAIKSKSIDEISAMADQRLPVPGADVAWLVQRVRELEGHLNECILQIMYLHEGHKETGSGNAVLSRARAVLHSEDAALTELARIGQEIEGEQEKRDREIRNKAFEEAAVAVDRLAYDAGEAEWRTEFSLSFASDLIRGLKEG